MTTRDIVFAVIGVIASASAILAVTTRNLVHAALWLVVCLGTIAGCYVVLGAELVALVQVLIYVGAVVVLVLFALMLTRSPIGPNRELASPWWQRILAAVLAVSVAVLLAVSLVPLVGEGALESKNGDTKAVSAAVFGTWVWPFELLSVLLLAALIGAFALAKIAGAGLVRTPRADSDPRGQRAVMHLWLPMLLASVLAGAGTYGVLARRNAVLVLIGVELILNAANVMLVGTGRRRRLTAPDRPVADPVHHHHRRRRDLRRPRRDPGHVQAPGAHRPVSAAAADLAGRRGGEPVTVLTTATVQLLVLLPALGALAGLLLRRRRAFSGLVAVAAAALAFVLSVFQYAETAGRSDVVPTFGPLPVGELQIPLNLLADRTSAVIAVVVAIVGLAVQVFSVWYLRDDSRYAVFASTVSLFLAAMLLVVQSERPRAHPGRLGGHGLVLLPPHRTRQRPRVGEASRLQGLPRHAGGRHRVRRRPGDPRRRRGQHRHRHGHRALGGPAGVGDRRARHRQPGADRRAGPAPRRRGGQVGPHPVPRLAPRRHGGPDARVRAHPRGDHGRGRHLRRRAPPPPVRDLRHRSHRPRACWPR